MLFNQKTSQFYQSKYPVQTEAGWMSAFTDLMFEARKWARLCLECPETMEHLEGVNRMYLRGKMVRAEVQA